MVNASCSTAAHGSTLWPVSNSNGVVPSVVRLPTKAIRGSVGIIFTQFETTPTSLGDLAVKTSYVGKTEGWISSAV